MVPSLSSVGSALAINIQPSDDAFGRFGFTADSQSRVVAEQQGGTPVILTIMRQGGRFGDVSVYWSVSQSGGEAGGAMDISPSEGVLEFGEGETEMDISLTINDDLVSGCVLAVWWPWSCVIMLGGKSQGLFDNQLCTSCTCTPVCTCTCAYMYMYVYNVVVHWHIKIKQEVPTFDPMCTCWLCVWWNGR